MTSSSSLYGPVNEQNTQSTNSTSLYGGADTPIPTPSGDVVVRGDLIVLSGNILTTATTGNIFPANATTINLGNAATAVNIGADTGTTTINNNLAVDGGITADNADFGNIQIAVVDNQTISTTAGELRLRSTSNAIKLPSVTSIYTDNTSSFGLLNQPTTVNAFLAATALNLGATTGTTNINNALLVESTGTFTGNITGPGATLGNVTVGIDTNNTISTSTGSLNLGASSTNNVNITSGSTAPTVITRNSDVTNTSIRGLALSAQTSLTPAAGFGASLEYQVEAQPGNTERAGYISVNSTDVTTGSEDFSMYFGLMQNGAAYDTKMILDSTGSLALDNNLTIGGTSVNLAQGTIFAYSENGDRLNRPEVQSTTGNSSGFRVIAPNTGTSASSTISVGNSSDSANTEFLALQSRGSGLGNTFRFFTGAYIANVLNATNKSIAFTDNTNTYATVNPSGPTIGTDLTTKAYVDAQVDANTTYTIDATATTGGANFNLVGSDSTTDTIKFAGGTNVTVTRTDANTITISAPDTNTTYTQNISAATGGANLNLVGSDSTTDTVKFADGTGVTVSYTDPSTATIAIGQAVGTTDNVQFNGVTSNSVTTGTINANGGVSFVDTSPMGGTYATVNQFGPFNGTDLTTVDYVNSVLPTVVTYTQDASTTTGGANVNLVGSNSTTDTIKYAGAGSVSVVATDANTVTITGTDTNTTYTIDASSTTGGANLNLVGSDSTTDTVKIASGTGVTVSQTNANELSVAIGQAVGTSDNVTFGSVDANITDGNYVVGQLIASRNTSYVPPVNALTTVTGTNGIVISSSTGGANGYTAGLAIRYHTGDTTAGGFNAPAISYSAATGTSSAPGGGFSANLVLGTANYDGYTSGTSNNYASQIATINQGAGTNAIQPLQLQGYARQTFTNSTTLTTAVTGASGTGTTATLTFTTQNTAPYFVGQSVTIAGMTPSGYNGTYTITAATTSSISYANATTGFTTGGTIAAANTVTAAGTGFRIRGFANSTNMSTANRFNFYDHTASAATFKSDAYTFADSVITGSTLTQKNYMTLGATVGSINQDTFTLKNSAATTTYATLNSTSATLNGDTVNLRNTAGTTTYVNATSTGTTITGAGLSTVTRTTVGTPGSAESRPSMNIQLTRSDQATPNDFDSTSFRTRVAGSNGTFYTISDINSVYKTGGDVQFNVNLANGDQTTGSFSSLAVYSGSITKTTIRAGTASSTPGASTVSDILTIEPTKITAAAPIKFPTYTAAQANAITGAVGWQISISDSASGGNPNGMMAFWDTTNARWSYIHDNSAV